jgi:Kef-type K+ transport system membrane component KefB
MALVLGAISCASAPAVILTIIHEYKARGPFTTTLLAIIALDDAIAVIAYTIGSKVAETLVTGFKSISWYRMLVFPTIDIVGSILLGIALGFGLIYISRFTKTRPQLLAMVLGTILLCVGVTQALGISSILANMAIGFVIVNKMRYKADMFYVINDIEGIIFAMFFTLAGAHFDFRAIIMAGILAVLIVVGRCGGKFVGANLGASISHAPLVIKKYLGLGLLPAAGVTVGLAMLIKQHPPLLGVEDVMINSVLASVIINELVTPPFAKYAIFKAGEAFKRG